MESVSQSSTEVAQSLKSGMTSRTLPPGCTKTTIQQLLGEPLALDKDIMYPGNRVYSPKNCLLVLTKLNNFFVGSGFDRRTHAELAHGIQLSARHFVTGKVTKLGRYESLENARKAWAAYKNEHLKSVVIPWYIGQVIPEHIDNHMVFKVIQILRSYEFK